MVLKNAVRRRDYLKSVLPYKMRISDLNKPQYNQLLKWLIENVKPNNCQVPDYRNKGSIVFQFLLKKQYEEFKSLLSK